MADFTNYGEARIVEFLNNEAPAAPAVLAVKLHTGAPGEDAAANASAETVRVVGTFTSTADTLVLSTPVEWLVWDAGNETITHVSAWDDVDHGQGNPWFIAALSPSRAVEDGDDLSLDTLVFTIA